MVITGMIGNTFEWYDFAYLAILLLIIGDLFFPGTDRVTKLLAVFTTFATIYIFRPLREVGGTTLETVMPVNKLLQLFYSWLSNNHYWFFANLLSMGRKRFRILVFMRIL